MMKKLRFKLLSVTLTAILFFFCFGNNSSAQNSDSLKYIMHAFVKIKTIDGMVIYIDPALVNSFEDSADVVLITHEHGDHNDLSKVKRKVSCKVIRAADALKSGVYQTFTIGNVIIKAVPAYNANHPKNSCVGYVVEFDSIKIYHPGDTGKITEMADLASQNINYAFWPMEGTYTMTPEVATEAAAMVNAKHDIPIHTLPGQAGYNDQFVARFTSPNKLVVRPGTTIALTNLTTFIKERSGKPQGFKLEQNYPNPFNPETSISFQLPIPSKVELLIYNVLGSEVKTLLNEEIAAGIYSAKWNGEDDFGEIVPSGIYFCSFKTSEYSETRKMIFTK